jgi:hypothetical protein
MARRLGILGARRLAVRGSVLGRGLLATCGSVLGRGLLASCGAMLTSGLLAACSGSSEGPPVASGPAPIGTGGSTTSGEKAPTCKAGTSAGDAGTPAGEAGTSASAVQKPVFVKNLPGETSWYASPVVADLAGDGKKELVAAYYSIFIYDSTGKQLAKASDGEGRVYAPHVVADIDGDGKDEIVIGNGKNVIAYGWQGGALVKRWTADTTTAGESPEVRGLAGADLDGDGKIEIIATTTQTQPSEKGGAQVFVYAPDGTLYQPPGLAYTAWPRYNHATGAGNDADSIGQRENGYGCYGLNVGVGDIDGDKLPEILVTYDDHEIQAFKNTGVEILASDWFKNRDPKRLDQRMSWGQFIRWADPKVEENHYHLHTGDWPDINQTEWLQWTASPPSVADIDGDGKNEVIGVPNVEMHEPYVTQAYAVMVLEGAEGDASRSAMRKPGWETLPRGGAPILVDGYYPPIGVPAPTIVNIQGDSKPEILVSLNDGFFHAFDGAGKEIWKYNYTFGKAVMYASEATVADLNQDGSPEIVFTTYGDPNTSDSGNLVILGADGAVLHTVPLPNPGHNGNGNGAPAAPALYDWDGDGQIEIFVQTFDHGMDIFRVPGSGTNCVLWPTSRGGPLRSGHQEG